MYCFLILFCCKHNLSITYSICKKSFVWQNCFVNIFTFACLMEGKPSPIIRHGAEYNEWNFLAYQGSSDNDVRSNVYDRTEFMIVSNCCYLNCCFAKCVHFVILSSLLSCQSSRYIARDESCVHLDLFACFVCVLVYCWACILVYLGTCVLVYLLICVFDYLRSHILFTCIVVFLYTCVFVDLCTCVLVNLRTCVFVDLCTCVLVNLRTCVFGHFCTFVLLYLCIGLLAYLSCCLFE